MLKRQMKWLFRRKAWDAKKKAAKQVLIPRCREDGKPELGRFTKWEIERILSQAESNIKELMPYFDDRDNLGNYMTEYGGLLDLAMYRALVKEGVDKDYAMGLVADMIWQARSNANGLLPVIDPMRKRLARMRSRNDTDFLRRVLEDALKFPYSEPGYRAKLHREKDVYHMDFYSCPVYDFYRKFGEEEMRMFRRTWCTFDYSVAQSILKGCRYERKHTLSDGDKVCDMRWFIRK